MLCCDAGDLALALLMFRVFADNAHAAMAADNLALVTNLFYGTPYFHLLSPVAAWAAVSYLRFSYTPGIFL